MYRAVRSGLFALFFFASSIFPLVVEAACPSSFPMLRYGSEYVQDATVYAGIGKPIYSPGESITVYGFVGFSYANEPWEWGAGAGIYVLNSGVSEYLTVADTSSGDPYSLYPFASGSVSYSAPNAIGSYSVEILAWASTPLNISDGLSGGVYCSLPYTVCAANYGSSCAYNSCGNPNGYIQCNGSCSAGPVERSYYNTACTLYSNSNNCGVTNTASGRIYCDPGTCTGSAPSAPPNVPGIGSPCNINACGDPSGYLTCSSNGLSAICSGPVVQRFNYGTSCSLTSLPNACGQTTTVAGSGTIGCDSFTCTGTPPAAPSNNGCVPPAPVVHGPGTVPAFNPNGYNIYATGYTPIPGAKLNYYFEWSRDGTTWSGSAPSWPTIP